MPDQSKSRTRADLLSVAERILLLSGDEASSEVTDFLIDLELDVSGPLDASEMKTLLWAFVNISRVLSLKASEDPAPNSNPKTEIRSATQAVRWLALQAEQPSEHAV